MFSKIFSGSLLIIFLLLSIQGMAQIPQIKSIGLPFITSYGPGDYNLGSQNFDVLVGQDNRIYVANYNGILIHDGHNWDQIVVPGGEGLYSIAQAENGTIFVGGVNEFGFLTTNQNGSLIYESLTDQLQTDDSNFVAWFACILNQKAYFTTTNFLIEIDVETKAVKSIPTNRAYWTLVKGQEHLYSYRNDSIYQLNNGKWESLRPSKFQYQRGNGRFTLATDSKGHAILIKYDGFFDFETEEPLELQSPALGDFLKTSVFRLATTYKDYLFLTSSKGLMICDFKGRVYQYLTKEKGLSANLTYTAKVDQNNILWLGTNNGIDKIETFSPYSIIDQRKGVEGIIGYLAVVEDQMYLSGATGLSSANFNSLSDPMSAYQFQNIESEIGWKLLATDHELISLNSGKAFIVKAGKVVQTLETGPGHLWRGVVWDNNNLLLGSSVGSLTHYQKQNNLWKKVRTHENLFSYTEFFAMDKSRNIWTSDNQGVYKVNFDPVTSEVKVARYGEKDGLPQDDFNFAYGISGDVIFTTYKGLYRYREDLDRFEPDDLLNSFVGTEGQVSKIFDDPQDNLYYYKGELTMLRRQGNSYVKENLGHQKLSEYYPQHIYPRDSANLYIASFDCFLHIDPTYQQTDQPYHINFSSVEEIGGSDTTWFAGFGTMDENYVLPHDQNNLRIHFASTYYGNPDKTTYQWKLEGFDEDWSKWSTEHRKDYTNIPHGNYTFFVKAKNVLGKESEVRRLTFTVHSPWYQTVWAYGLYGLFFIGFVWGLVKLNTRRLERDKLRLEGIVEERTAEIRKQKEQAEKDAATISNQHDQLVQADELKSRFFVNISHELRTPLTLTMGTVDQTLKGKFGQLNHEQYANLKVSYRNSERLLKMVNNILDISKLEGGKVQLYAQELDLRALINKVVAFFQSKMDDKKITLSKDLQSRKLLFLDKDKIETVLINLIANAFKFTPVGGTITIKTRDIENEVELVITDSGVGIPANDLPYVFDRFYQSEHLKSGEGTGVGLALSKELIDLHQAGIKAQSQLEEGTTFTILFKTGKAHLQPNQVIESEAFYKPITEKMPELSTPQTSQEISATQPEGRQHVLVVEDNYEMSRFILQILEDQYQLTFAQDGQQAIGLLEKGQSFDLILTDYMMPIMNGYEMAMEIKKQNEWALIPMIFLTARAQEQDKIDLLNIGVDDYLYKPFNEDELKARINNLLKAKTQRAEYWIEKTIDPRDIEWKEFPSKLKLDINAYIQEHIKEDISGKDLEAITGQSERSLYRKVKANTGLTLNQYIKEFKLRKARALLENKQVMTVSEAANAVGFNYLHNFTNNFKDRFGKLPSEYLD